jgi:hypothetical protein
LFALTQAPGGERLLMLRKFIKTGVYCFVGAVAWKYIDSLESDATKKIAYDKGREFSQSMKSKSAVLKLGWDDYVEPLIVKQFAVVFGVTNAFILGMLSDNENIPASIDEDLERLKVDIDKDASEIKSRSPSVKQIKD